MKNVGVVLSGCGVYDGSEIHEATLTLLFLNKAGVKATCFAPDIEQYHTINHLNREVQQKEKRQVLLESARIARGEIEDVSKLKTELLDGLIFPGGSGVAKNLCDFAFKAENCSVHEDVKKIIKAMHAEKKPQGFICIAPVLAAKVLGSFKPQLTIGSDKLTGELLEKMGAEHIVANVDEIIYDANNRLISTPAYMIGPTISDIAIGIEKLVQKIVEVS